MTQGAAPPAGPMGAADRVRAVLLGTSALLCAAVAYCYYARPDACAAVTLYPVWFWPAPGLLLAGAARSRRHRRALGAVALLWLAFLLAAADEPAALMRSPARVDRAWADARRDGKALRVVSLNCAVGNPAAAAEVAAFAPDLVLLQETPARQDVAALARRLYGKDATFAWGIDCSILARGRVEPAALPSQMQRSITQARIRLQTGLVLDAVSIHLIPPVAREDLWNRSCWRAQRENRAARREELRTCISYLDAVPAEVPLLVGGDYNAPAGDAIFRLLQPRLHDSFREGGAGWSNTVLNDFPFLRIDQVWVSSHFRAVRVFARRTRHSDHRMVVCDLW